MLRRNSTRSRPAAGRRFAIIASRYNARYVDAMLRAAKAALLKAGAAGVQVIRVPGAYEIPIVAARLARISSNAAALDPRPMAPTNRSIDGIVCLGVILRGQTVHAAHIGDAVSRALMEIQLRYEVPVIHEVLLLENEAQARARCLDRDHNRGTEAAQTALAMAEVMTRLAQP